MVTYTLSMGMPGTVNAPALKPLMAALQERGAEAALVTLVFALLAHRIRGVSLSGAITGGVISFLLYAAGGSGAFITLLTVFVLVALATWLRSGHKGRLGVAERRSGRSGWQVLANLGVATVVCVLSLLRWREPLLLASIAALAEAAADTVSSECGQALTNRVYMITNFRRVRVGLDGGISVIGTAAGIIAAVLVSVAAAWTGLIPQHWIAAAAGAAVLGSIFDSLLGATLQQRGWLNNSVVNVLSTAAAAGIAMAFLT